MPTVGNVHFLEPPPRPVPNTKVDVVLTIEYDEELSVPLLLRWFVEAEWSYKLTMRVFAAAGAEPTAERVLKGLTRRQVREHAEWEKTRLMLGGEYRCYDETNEVLSEFYGVATHKYGKPILSSAR